MKWSRLFSKRLHFKYVYIDDVPEIYLPKTFNIVGTSNFWLITFICPCGCNEIVNLNLLKDSYPQWYYTIKKKKINIYPSVKRKQGCKSHFIIRKNKIEYI
ncbi:MAG: DUF6527 family protein [Bacteroidales bacterium]